MHNTTITGGDHRQKRDHHYQVPLGRLFGGFQHLFDAHHNGEHLLVGGYQQGPQVLVPTVDEQNHEQRGNVGARQGDQNIPEEPHGACTVDCGSLDQGFGDRLDGRNEEQEV